MASYSAPTPAEAMQRFLDTEGPLEKPLLFERNDSKFKQLLCCQAATMSLLTGCITAFFVPVASFCPFTYADQYSLRLDKDALTFQGAQNDCCCHIAKTLKTVPLEKVQDVELQSNCLLSCFGLKAVNVQTAGQGSIAPEISATFLKSPEKVREAIRLAVKLHNQQGGGQAGMLRAPVAAWGEVSAAPGATKGCGMAQRLQDLEGLVSRGVLSRTEADGLKVCVLAARDGLWLARLAEAADLRDRTSLNSFEFEQLKASLVAQLKAAV